jgi:GGDEF domain-containing protein
MVIDLADRVGVVISHAELFATVERQAITDPMTGLFNRRYFEEQLTKGNRSFSTLRSPLLIHHRRLRLSQAHQR